MGPLREYHHKDMSYVTPLTLGVLEHSIYWFRTEGGDGRSDLPRLRRTVPSTVMPAVRSCHWTIFLKGRIFTCLYFKGKAWPVHMNWNGSWKPQIPVAQKPLSKILQKGTSVAPLSLMCFILRCERKHPRIQHSVQLSLHQPLSNCISSWRGKYRDTCNTSAGKLNYSARVGCLTYRLYNSKCHEI